MRYTDKPAFLEIQSTLTEPSFLKGLLLPQQAKDIFSGKLSLTSEYYKSLCLSDKRKFFLKHLKLSDHLHFSKPPFCFGFVPKSNQAFFNALVDLFEESQPLSLFCFSEDLGQPSLKTVSRWASLVSSDQFNRLKKIISLNKSNTSSFNQTASQHKAQKTLMARYGVTNPSQSSEVQDKKRKNYKSLTGYDHPLQNPEVRAKAASTTVERYGSSMPLNDPASGAYKKARTTSLARYGTDHPASSLEIRGKAQATLESRYGVANPAQSKDLLAKAQATLQSHYGVSHPSQSPQIQDKAQATLLEKYGTTALLNDPTTDVYKKAKATLESHYGVSNPFQSSVIMERAQQTKKIHHNRVFFERLKALSSQYDCTPLFTEDDVESVFLTSEDGHSSYRYLEFKHNTCGRTFKHNLEEHPICPYCYKHKMTSSRELLVKKYLESRGILCYKSRDQIKSPTTNGSMELDLFCPDHHIALEFNGLYYPSQNPYNSLLDPYYHRLKSDLCLNHLNESGDPDPIYLYHIWEDLPDDHLYTLLDDIFHLDDQSFSKTLFARSLEPDFSKTKNVRDFFDQNHTHGNSPNASLIVSLSDPKTHDIVSAISLSFNPKTRYWNNERYCVKHGVRIVGGFQRLLHLAKSQILKQQPESRGIVTYVDRDLTPDKSNNVYARNGFTLQGETSSVQLTYFVLKTLADPFGKLRYLGGRRYSRRHFQKSNLAKLFPGIDTTLTEKDLCIQHGIFPCYNSGTWKYILDF